MTVDTFNLGVTCEPTVSLEGGHRLYHFPNFYWVSDSKFVEMMFEWPLRNRLLFSEKISTPRYPTANWAYPDVWVGGKKWQGISLTTGEQSPPRALLAILGTIGW